MLSIQNHKSVETPTPKAPIKVFRETIKEEVFPRKKTAMEQHDELEINSEYAKMNAQNQSLSTPRTNAIRGLNHHSLMKESSMARAMKVMEEVAMISNNVMGTVTALNREMSVGKCFSEQDSLSSRDFNPKVSRDH